MFDGGWGIDVMMGFLGEIDEVFQNMYCFLWLIDCIYFYVFFYSLWEGIGVVILLNFVFLLVKKECIRVLIILSECLRCAYWERSVG